MSSLGGVSERWADLESGVPGAIAAFPDGAAIGSAGRPTTTTPPTEPGSVAGGDVVAVPAPTGGKGTNGRPLLAGGAGAALLAAGLAGLIRRHRAATLP